MSKVVNKATSYQRQRKSRCMLLMVVIYNCDTHNVRISVLLLLVLVSQLHRMQGKFVSHACRCQQSLSFIATSGRIEFSIIKFLCNKGTELVQHF